MMSFEEFLHLVLDDFFGLPNNEDMAEYLTDKILDKVKLGEIKELQARLPQPAPT